MTPTRRKALLGIAGGAVVLTGWALFRPELLFVNQTVNETLPAVQAASARPSALLEGTFHAGSHETEGAAAVHMLEGRRVLRLTGFKTSNGPDLRVYLVAAGDAKDNDTVKQAGFVDLGALKGNQGDQNYTVPADLDLAKYRAVTIWCRRFGVNFGTAPLKEASRSAAGPSELSRGRFHSVAHDTEGAAALLHTPDGGRLVRLSGFKTSNGPDLRVYLVAAGDAKDNDTVKQAGFVDLGALKGNQGDQNYTVPADLDLAKYRAVTIWCRRFGVNFGTAPLGAGGA